MFIILLYTFLVTSFALYKEYNTCLISFSKFLDVLPPAFTCARAIDILWSIYLSVTIFNPFPRVVSYLASDTIEE